MWICAAGTCFLHVFAILACATKRGKALAPIQLAELNP